jgi:hypothetical protein
MRSQSAQSVPGRVVVCVDEGLEQVGELMPMMAVANGMSTDALT